MLVAAALCGCSFFTGSSLKNKVVLDVNGRQMTAAAFAEEMVRRLRDQDALSAKDPKNLKVVKAKIVEDFIVQTLTEEWAQAQGLLVKAEELEHAVKTVQINYPDDLAFQQALAEQGISFRDWKARLQGTLLQKIVADKVIQNIGVPTDAEMQSYFRDHTADFAVRETAKIRQIVVATESDAASIEKALKSGKRMADLAKTYSISPEGPQGGMVGLVEKGLTDVFESAFRMKQGMRSPVIKSAFGYHIFEVAERKPARNRPFPEAKDEIKRILMEKKRQSLYLSWLEERVRGARVFKDQAFIDALKVETKVQ
jgi:parvulin-like peptidyl-prolyl isomerase